MQFVYNHFRWLFLNGTKLLAIYNISFVPRHSFLSNFQKFNNKRRNY